jgi:hypothetical protein
MCVFFSFGSLGGWPWLTSVGLREAQRSLDSGCTLGQHSSCGFFSLDLWLMVNGRGDALDPSHTNVFQAFVHVTSTSQLTQPRLTSLGQGSIHCLLLWKTLQRHTVEALGVQFYSFTNIFFFLAVSEFELRASCLGCAIQ